MNFGPWPFPAGGSLQTITVTTQTPTVAQSGLVCFNATITCGTHSQTVGLVADTSGGIDVATAICNALNAQCVAFAQSVSALGAAINAGLA